MSKLSPFVSVKPSVRRIVRRPSSVVSFVTVSAPTFSKDIAGKFKTSTPAAVCVKSPAMVSARREPQPAHVGHRPGAAVDGDIVAERRIPTKVRSPLPIVIVPPVHLPKGLPDPPVTVTLA